MYLFSNKAGYFKPTKKLHRNFLAVLVFLFHSSAFAQQYDTVSVFKLPVSLDSYVVQSGFNVDAFIRRVRTDTTFYKAFKNMRFVPYTAVNSMDVFDKKGRVAASWRSKSAQQISKGCRTTTITEEQTTGDFYKRNGEYRYYTAELFDHLFFAKTPICNESDVVAGGIAEHGKGQKAKSTYELKQLVFNPGSKVSGVPFMGDRASIFDRGEAEKYDFSIRREDHEGELCYVFRIVPKPGYERKTLYNELTTWFRISDYSIVARNYSLSFSTLVYDFNVRMKVRTKQVGNKLYPTSIDYDGNWHVFTKKREPVRFSVVVRY